MSEQFSIDAPAHPTSSASCGISPYGISPLSAPPRLPASDSEEMAPSTITGADSRLDEMNPQRDEISSSFLSASSKSTNVSQDAIFLPDSLVVGGDYGNDVSLDSRQENAAESRESLWSSSSNLHICRRLQRQLNSHLMFTHSQLNAVSDQLEEMVSTESQCHVTTRSVILPPQPGQSSTQHLDDSQANEGGSPIPINDEGYFEGNTGDNEELDTEALYTSLRQAAAPLGVRRNPRGSVFSKPRMRRNIMKRKRDGDQPGG